MMRECRASDRARWARRARREQVEDSRVERFLSRRNVAQLLRGFGYEALRFLPRRASP